MRRPEAIATAGGLPSRSASIVAVIVVSTLTHRSRPGAEGARRARRQQLARTQDDIGRLGVHARAAAGSSSRTCSSTACVPDEPPWLVAKRIEVSLTWGALFHREVLLDSASR